VNGNHEAKFGLVVRFDLKAESAESFDRLVDETVRQIHKSETGTFAYLVHSVPDAPASRVFYECYRDKKAFEEHERQPHVKRFLAEREQYLVNEPTVWWLSPAGGVTRSAFGGNDG
jgi:quinol monooxygenase YgiN